MSYKTAEDYLAQAERLGEALGLDTKDEAIVYTLAQGLAAAWRDGWVAPAIEANRKSLRRA
jgi:hypothetical protein